MSLRNPDNLRRRRSEADFGSDCYDTRLWLPTSVKEVERLGWSHIDVILMAGDAYVDHPSFGMAVIGRVLQAHGYNVAIVPQPNWRDDLRDFKKLGRPRLFFGVSPGAMDSMVNHYTAARRRRSDDAYTAGGRHGMRPDYPTLVYSGILRQLWPDVPIVIGGIEASLRRLSHYDYWQDKLRPSILSESEADILVYGMGEKPIVEIADRLSAGMVISEITDIPQTAVMVEKSDVPPPDDSNIVLSSFEECLKSKRLQSLNFKNIEQQSNRLNGGATLWQVTEDKAVKVNPMYPPMTTEELDGSYDLPYTRLPHPRYKGKTIPAWEMIRHSITMHRGCFGGCAFCTISAHQGKFISSRSKQSIINEAKKIIQMPDFKGYISDLGGPSANMYRMSGHNRDICDKCLRPSCLHPRPCANLNTDHTHLLDVYHAIDALPGVKKSFIGSGVRYDLAMHMTGNNRTDETNRKYCNELICNHVSGRLKVAPEHTAPHVLSIMRKPAFNQYFEFKRIFDKINRERGLKQQLIPYFISSHPGCREVDMAELSATTSSLDIRPEQIQDFTPTPMTVSTEIYYSGIHPYTGEKIYCATRPEEKMAQRQYFFWYDEKYRPSIIERLKKLDRMDLVMKLYPGYYKYPVMRQDKRKAKQTKKR